MLKFLIEHRTTVFLAVLFIFLFGTQSYLTLPREGPPDINIPVVLVNTLYLGVSPEDVESLVTTPLENELASVKDVKKMSSTSAEGVSVISLEFMPDVDIQDALQKVRERVARARSKLPTDIQEPTVREISFEDFPVLIVSLAGQVDPEAMKKTAEDLQDSLQRIPGVLEVRISGAMTRQFRVQADPDRLANYSVTLDELSQAIGQENVNIPSGTVTTGDARYLLRVPGELKSAADIEQIAVKKVSEKPVLVKDVARVVDGWADRDSYARMNGIPAVSLSITKRTGSNIVEIAEEARQICDEAQEDWPEGLSWRFVSDQSRRVKDMVAELQNSVVVALVLVVSVAFLALSVRNSLFVGLAIPLSLFITFNVLEVMGTTLNMIVLFSLILVLGMLLDDAIVVVENIYRHLEEGMGLKDAAIAGTRQVSAAVISSTATTVAAFLPLLFWTGIMGEFMGYLPQVVIISLTASLGVAVLVLPVISASFMKKGHTEGRSISNEEDLLPADTPRKRVMLKYRDLLAWSIDHRYRSAAAGVVALLGTFVAFGFLNKGVEFFPDTEPDRATLSIRAPDGTDLEATDHIVKDVEAILQQEPDIDVYMAESGVSGGGLSGSQNATNQARISLQFRPHRNQAEEGETPREEDTRAVIDRIRKAVAAIPGAAITVDRAKMGPPTGADVGVEVVGKDFHAVGALAQKVQRELAQVPGVTDLTNDYRVGRPEMRLRIDRVAARKIGTSILRLASEIRTALSGTKATAIRDGKDEHEVRVEMDPAWRDDLQKVLSLRITGRDDKNNPAPVPLSAVARFEMAGGSGAIKHVDQDLVVTITGDVLDGYNANAVRTQVAKVLEAYPAPEGTLLRMGGVSQDQQEAQRFLTRAFGIGLALILVVLILHFDSLSVPVIILSSVILSLIGVLWGLVITGTPFGIIMTGLGVISLAGVVTKNAIVLLDYVQKLEAQGMDMRRALITSGITRFRPVMLTAGAAVVGLIPMALGLNFDLGRLKVLWGGSSAEMWGPMAIAIIFGLTVATVLTLVMVPTLYSIWHDISKLLSRFSGAGAAGALLLLALLPRPADAATVTIQEVLQSADQKNLDLMLLSEQTVQAEAARGKAWSTFIPTVSARGGLTVNQHEIIMDFGSLIPEDIAEMFGIEMEPTVIQMKQYWSGSATVSQNLWNGAAIPGIRATNDRIASVQADEAATRLKVRALLVRLTWSLVATREATDLAEGAVKLARDQQELTRRLVAAGTAPERNRVQAELAVLKAQRDLLSAQEARTQVEQAFAKATGLDPTVVIQLSEDGDVPPSLDDALDLARQNRSDLRAARYRAASAERAVHAFQWGWAPTVSASFMESWSENTSFSTYHWNWMLTVNANWSLWDGGLRLAQTREAQSMARASWILVDKKRQDIEEEVKNAWARRERALAAYESASREVTLAEENLRLARKGYEVGSATWLDVDAATLGANRARLGLVQERMNRELARVELLVAVGEGI